MAEPIVLSRRTADPIRDQITTLKQKLANTDYKAIKFAEGLLTAEEYEPTKVQRQAWRDEINALEASLIN